MPPKITLKKKIVTKTIEAPEDLEIFIYNGQTYYFSEFLGEIIFEWDDTANHYNEIGGIYDVIDQGIDKRMIYINNTQISPKEISF